MHAAIVRVGLQWLGMIGMIGMWVKCVASGLQGNRGCSLVCARVALIGC